MDGGRELLRTILEATGLPLDLMEPELIRILEERGLDPDHVTFPELREALAVYLQTALLEAKGVS